MAVAGAGAGVGAGTEIIDKGGAGAENKYFRLRNTGVKDIILVNFATILNTGNPVQLVFYANIFYFVINMMICGLRK